MGTLAEAQPLSVTEVAQYTEHLQSPYLVNYAHWTRAVQAFMQQRQIAKPDT